MNYFQNFETVSTHWYLPTALLHSSCNIELILSHFIFIYIYIYIYI